MNDTVDPILRQQFLDGMSHTACTVNVVTTDGPAGRAGVTVSAMSSVSADTPRPSLLVCVHHLSPAADRIVENGAFCVNVLQDHQSYISDTFAGRRKTEDGDKFSCTRWTTQKTGCPRIVDPLVAFDCTVTSGERVGTHHVFIGEVVDIFNAERGSPLIFAHRSYGSPTRIKPVGGAKSDTGTAGKILSVGCFHTFGPFVLPELLSSMAKQDDPIEVRVIEGDQRTLVASLMSGESELALLYDLDLDEGLECEELTSLRPYVLFAKDHPLAASQELSVNNLIDEPLVLLDAPPSRDYFLSIFTEAGLEPRLGHSSSSFEMVRGMVGHGLGYSLLATRPASDMTYDGKALIARPLITNVASSRMVLARRRDSSWSPSAEEFARCCRKHFASDT